MPINNTVEGLPWRSSGSDSAFPLQGPWVLSLVRELGPLMPHGIAKKKTSKNQNGGSSLVP